MNAILDQFHQPLEAEEGHQNARALAQHLHDLGLLLRVGALRFTPATTDALASASIELAAALWVKPDDA